jgi:ACS family glucarate transporter-like MFS transporter
MGVLGRAAPEQEHARDVHHVHPQLYDLLLLHHWLPTYLRQRHGFDATSLGIFAGLPLIVSMPGDLLGGMVTDRLAARYGLKIGRCTLGAAAYLIAGVALISAAVSSTPIVAATLIAVATGMAMFTLGAA